MGGLRHNHYGCSSSFHEERQLAYIHKTDLNKIVYKKENIKKEGKKTKQNPTYSFVLRTNV